MDLNTAQNLGFDPDLTIEESSVATGGWEDWLGSPYYTLVAGMLAGLLVNLLSRQLPRSAARGVDNRPMGLHSFSQLLGCSKMVLVVRTDLGMTKGKVAAQCAHAALDCYKKAVKRHQDALNAWETTGQTKVCLKIDSEAALLDLAAEAKKNGINFGVVRDAGRTQVDAGSLTVLGIGPAKIEQIDKITGHLKLY